MKQVSSTEPEFQRTTLWLTHSTLLHLLIFSRYKTFDSHKIRPNLSHSGTVDECNAAIGLATSHLATPPYPLSDTESDRQKLLSRLQLVQHYLFDLGAHLATPRTTSPSAKLSRTQFSSNAAAELEIWIDEMDTKLEPLTTFVLPGGHPSAAALHLARTIARRAERAVTPLRAQQQSQMDSSAYCFINRLSDFLFVSSRFANLIMGSQDVKWRQITTRPDIPSSKNAV